MKGIDISSYQENVDFKKVKNNGIEIVYIKATEGLTYDNPLLKSQYNGAKSAGLKIGFYHLLRANDPTLEAKHFLSVINGCFCLSRQKGILFINFKRHCCLLKLINNI